MNKIYKVVWSKVRSAWVVTSEIAKGHGKDSSSGRNRSMLKAGVVMALLGGFMTAGISPVAAELTQDQQAVYDAVMANLVKKMNIRLSDNNIVAGRDIEVYGGHNAVFGTDYSNLDNKLTKVTGKNNTVIGVGNLVGYTATLDETDNKTWIYKKKKYGSDQNVAVGMKNTVNGGSIAIGTSSEVMSLGTSVGHGNEIISGDDYGLALGNHLKVDGHQAIAVGSESEATARWATAIGQKAMAKASYTTAIGMEAAAEAYSATAIGQKAKAKANFTAAIGQEAIAEGAGSVAIGLDTKAIAINGVALGTYSVADRAKGVTGYLAGEEDTEAAWKATGAAVSVGNMDDEYTRQIIGVAAGTEDTDAVNVAQLKAIDRKLAQGAIHYYSVTSDKKAAGSNYDNDGAKADDSMVIGIGSIAETKNSTVLGNNNTVTATDIGVNNNIVAGQNIDVHGGQNAVFGTQYQNGTDIVPTKVAGMRNTVIGVGNLVGYVAKKVSEDSDELTYEKARGVGSDENVVVGMTNIANFDSIVIGTNSEAKNKGTSIGHANKIGADDWGVALGNYLTVNGYQAIAVGSQSKATAGWTTAIGQEASAEKIVAVALGYKAKAQNKYSTALGAFAKATAEDGIAIGSGSLADRAAFTAEKKGEFSDFDLKGNTFGAVSVGKKDKLRQIINVGDATEDTDAVNLRQLKALDQKVAQGAIHYYSVTSDKKAAGSNYDNDGAKAADSMVIGIGSTSEGINSTVIGNNNKLTGNKSIKRAGKVVTVNNSIVAGQNLEVDGYSNTVFATESVYDMYQRQTKVAGDHNTVIGAGNIVGYSEEDNGTGHTYTKLWPNISSNKNVVIGTRQTVSGSENVALGYLTKFEEGADQVTTLGIENTIGSETREGVAIGNHLGINGPQTVAIGFGSEANAESAISIGNGSYANAKSSVAIGGPLVTEGPPATEGALATVENGVALGSGSVADREAGMAGYLSNGKTTAEWQATLGALSVGMVSDEWTDTRQITGVAAGTENTDAVNVAQLKALNTKLDNGAIHYYSVTSDKKAAGSNFDNDGAKADDSMVIGIGSISEGINSTVVGNNNTLKNTLKGGPRDRDGVLRNNSIVAGENIEVDGTRNAVFATDYKEGEHKLTKVAGKHNTVIGVGNLVGYTAKADPNNRNEFIYEKTDVTGSHDNVVVGMTNTVKGSSVVVGTSSEIKDGAQLGTSVGHANVIQGKGQYGVALGNHLLVAGDQSVVIGTDSKATADWATAIGSETKAVTEDGVALGSYSVADRAKGVIGYLAGDKKSKTWKSTLGALSIGGGEYNDTRQITGVAAGSEDTDAVNVAQLKAAAKSITESITDTTLQKGNNALSLDGSKLSLSVKDTAGNEVTGSVDLKLIQDAVDTNTTYTMTGTENAADNTTTISLKGSDGKEQKVTVATKDTNTYTTGGTYDAANKKLVFTQNDPSKNYEVDVSKMISDVVDTDTRNTIVETDTVAVDASNKNADGSINYKLNVKTDGKIEKDNKGIVTGGTVYNETRVEKDGHYIKAENTAGQNLIALDKQVGANATNITKLENNIYNMGNRVGELDSRVDRVGAGAAALAALHPLDFDPDDKWDFAAGYGNYSGANAVAIGAYYRPNEDTMFSVGGSFGGGENMVNAGVSVKLGQGSNVTTSRVAMAREISDLKSKNEKMQEENKEMRNEIEILKEQMQKLMATK